MSPALRTGVGGALIATSVPLLVEGGPPLLLALASAEILAALAYLHLRAIRSRATA